MPDAKTKIIEGREFKVSQPYEAGHTLTEAEARQLNQVRAENIGNNLRKMVKEWEGSEEELRSKVEEYEASYTFAMPGVGSPRIVDPVEREAFALAKEYVKNRLASAGLKLNGVHPDYANLPEEEGKAQSKARYDAAIERAAQDEQILKLAKQRVAQKQKATDAANVDLGL